jgi:hypothetical protein
MQSKCCQREADNDCKNDVKDGFFHGGSFDGAEAPWVLLVFKPIIVEMLKRIISIIPSFKAALKLICHQMLESKQIASGVDFAKRFASDRANGVSLFHVVYSVVLLMNES